MKKILFTALVFAAVGFTASMQKNTAAASEDIRNVWFAQEEWSFVCTLSGGDVAEDAAPKRGKMIFNLDSGTVSVLRADYGAEYRWTEDKAAKTMTLKNVEVETDVLVYTVEESTPERKIWTRLENDVMERWVILKK